VTQTAGACHTGMSKRTIRILILVATASAALLVVAAPGIARRGGDDDRDRIRGTVASFADGVLTIRQSDGDEVEGKVNRRTEIECERHRNSTAVAAHDGDDDHGGRGRDHDDHGGRGRDHDEDDDGDGHHRGRGRDDDNHRGRHHDRRRCSARLLTAGRVVREADLLSTSSGPVFREVEIVR
jgi:hypothetical protein